MKTLPCLLGCNKSALLIHSDYAINVLLPCHLLIGYNIIVDINQAISYQEKNELDQLLWDVLWKPLNFKRDIRESFKLAKPQIDIVAVDNKVIIGALVANWLSSNEIEIRHIAVKTDFQKKAVGRLLVEELFRLIRDKTPLIIQTHARSTSVGFFSKLGFISLESVWKMMRSCDTGFGFNKCRSQNKVVTMRFPEQSGPCVIGWPGFTGIHTLNVLLNISQIISPGVTN